VFEIKTMNERVKHLITRWNPFWNPIDQFEPKTIEVHCEVLEKEQYVWWGKISKSGQLGINPTDVASINKQIASGVEVHFYIYCPDKLLLHVGKLEEISTSDLRGDPHTPKYYSNVPHKIPFWFKLSDIRKLDLQRFLNSSILREEDGTLFDPVTVRPHLRVVYENPPQTFFNYSLTGGRKWFSRGGIGAMIPRCFKTGGMICTNPDAGQSESKQRVFIGMPFRPEFENVYKHAIKPALDNLGLIPWKANEEIQNIDLMCKVCGGIQICASAIVDISDWNSNVMFELGLVYGLGKEAFIIKRSDAKVPVDLQGMIYIPYDSYDELKNTLMKYLAKLMQRG
jgi:hypothetical protein